MDAKVAVFGTLRFPAENIPSLLPHLRQLVKTTQEQDGCLLYEVAEDPFEPGLIRFSELWPDRQSLDAHLMAAHIAPWREQARQHGLIQRQFFSYDISAQAIEV